MLEDTAQLYDPNIEPDSSTSKEIVEKVDKTQVEKSRLREFHLTCGNRKVTRERGRMRILLGHVSWYT